MVSLLMLFAGCHRNPVDPETEAAWPVVQWEQLPCRMLYVGDYSAHIEDRKSVFLLDPASKSIKRLFSLRSDQAIISGLALSKDGNTLAFAVFDSAKYEGYRIISPPKRIYVTPLDAPVPVLAFANSKTSFRDPDWSSSGALAFLGADNEIWVDGALFLREDNVKYSPPKWSADGKHLLFTRTTSTWTASTKSLVGVYSTNVTSRLSRVIFADTSSSIPAQFRFPVTQVSMERLSTSLDGSRLLVEAHYFDSTFSIYHDVWMMDAGGSNPQRIVSRQRALNPIFNAVLSPDQSRIAHPADSWGAIRVYHIATAIDQEAIRPYGQFLFLPD